MNNNLKQISIRSFLARSGIVPARETPTSGMYLSPLREERTPSFSVNYIKNLWYDHGIGEGGSIIDLVMRLQNCGFREAVQYMENGNYALSVSS